MLRRRRSWVWGAGLILLAMWAGSRWLSAPADAPSAPTPAVTEILWREGEVQRYRFDILSTVAFSDRPDGAPESMTQHLRAQLLCRTLRVEPDHALVGLELDPVDLRMDGVAVPATDAALGAPFTVRIDRRGMPVEFAFSRQVSEEHRELLEEWVRTFQVTLEHGGSWDAAERHRTGTYAARYERQDPARIQREKLHYEPPGVGPGAGPRVRVAASRATIQIDPTANWLQRMEVREELVATDETGIAFRVSTEALLERLAEAPSAPTRGVEVWQLDDGGASRSVGVATRTSAAITEMSTAELQSEIASIVHALDAAAEGRIEWVHRLRDWVRADRRAAALVLDALRSRERALEDRTRADLFLALELGGTDEAQGALCDVVAADSWGSRDRTRALIALGGVAHPSEATVTALWQTTWNRAGAEARSAANTALLALGAVASQINRQEDPARTTRYAHVRDGLLSAAWGAGDPRERAVAVLALGNTGDPEVAEQIEPFLDDGAAAVRRAAARTLGKLGADRGSEQLARRLAGETSSAVRGAMAAALATSARVPPESLAAVRAAIRGEQDDLTRYQLARVLGAHLADDPENRRVLTDLLERESSAKIRRYLAEVLARPAVGQVF